ncbi:acylphosphatase [Azospirillum doebereinerae]|uniref:acylphosphatase n=1 Tax=Azospirillum doebereinerae TaxID=92933 RepID=A0A3S0VET2_9PROT|nr:acylphosphatase [Azospirillum doebereinerae]MCG5243006.1 acylphosphatase [Azospirillum doebereinerae]RUQ65038.1 acylphosphatase [Azospirillum doebereinerae]
MTAAVPRKAVRAWISGKVQGVWYRGWTVETAGALGLSGWVRNRSDGSVEALFAGPPDAVDRMLEACRRGPSAAVVRAVTAEPASDPGEGGFEQRGTV